MQFLAAISLAVCVLLLAAFVVGFLKVFREGPSGSDQIDRAGFGAAEYWQASLPRQSASSSVATQEGILARGCGDKIVLRQTRTISRELL
jgi:hypothetical protein